MALTDSVVHLFWCIVQWELLQTLPIHTLFCLRQTKLLTIQHTALGDAQYKNSVAWLLSNDAVSYWRWLVLPSSFFQA